MVDREKLKSFKIFRDLNERETELIAGIAGEETYELGERIFAEKALATTLYLTLKGKVEIKVSGDCSEQVVIDRVGPGEIFGWSAVIEPYTFTAAAWTSEKTKLIALKGERLRELFVKNNHIGYRVIKEIAAVISRRLKALELKFAETVRAK
jgi:CRP-like cAMP-binding protein